MKVVLIYIGCILVCIRCSSLTQESQPSREEFQENQPSREEYRRLSITAFYKRTGQELEVQRKEQGPVVENDEFPEKLIDQSLKLSGFLVGLALIFFYFWPQISTLLKGFIPLLTISQWLSGTMDFSPFSYMQNMGDFSIGNFFDGLNFKFVEPLVEAFFSVVSRVGEIFTFGLQAVFG